MRDFKKYFICFSMLLTFSLSSYSNGKEIKKETTTKVENVEFQQPKWEKIMDAIIRIESGGKHDAKNGSSLGVLQITPICVAECNNILKRKGINKRFTLADRLSPTKSKEMFMIIMKAHNKSGSAKEACGIWSGGGRGVRPSYWKKFLKFYKG